MAPITATQIVQIAESYGAQQADKDIAQRVHLAETDCSAYNDYQQMLAGLDLPGSFDEERLFRTAFAIGYEAAFAEREKLVVEAQIVGTHAVRACYHCHTRYAKDLGTREGREYLDAAIIICVACIKRLGQRVA